MGKLIQLFGCTTANRVRIDALDHLATSFRASYTGGQEIPMLTLNADPLPLRTDTGGVIRFSGTRITLDLIIEQYENGCTPEEIVRAYDTLNLPDVYSAIGFYLRHQEAVRVYLARRAEESESLRTAIEAEHPPISQADLMARRLSREKDHAPVGQ